MKFKILPSFIQLAENRNLQVGATFGRSRLVRFVMDEVALGQIFVRVLPFFPANSIPPMRCTNSSSNTTVIDLLHNHIFLSVLLSTQGKMSEIS